jgi:hypothetical protein
MRIEEMIGRSVHEDDDAERDALRREGRKLIIDMMRKKAEEGARGIYYVMYHMDNWGFKLDDWPEIREMIDAHKHGIMVDLLRQLSMPGKDPEESVRFNLQRMRRIGVDWEELDTIEDSLRSDDEAGLTERILHLAGVGRP